MLAVILGPSATGDAPVPQVALTPKYALKWAISLTLFGAGMHYLSTGRKEADFGKIVTGALLTLACLAFLA